jgi:hypothetical protein
VPHAVKGLAILPFHELYRTLKGATPSGQLWDIYASLISTDGIIQRMIVMPPGAPPAAVEALRAAIVRVNADPAYGEEAEKTFGFVPQWAAGRAGVPRGLQDYMKNAPK